ncbi:hypothetical protein [Crossiella cryophila]|uniref:Uncharacterized protein n=1 Tax=Crossiella cryophila TaxID=43355 RepID=A0A7W7FUU3_9PSEU|nr:hypothetical protein [Crossiella cryophila]MBB4676164.1 hypothetical protein [Crossiella cryophila]
MSSSDLARRAFLARIGVLGAVTGAGVLLPPALAAAPVATAAAPPLPILVDLLRPILAELARDTLNGLTTFVVPGPDNYSRAQGTPVSSPGALEMGATDFMIEALDHFVPFPDQLAKPLSTAFVTALADTGIKLPDSLLGLIDLQVSTLDKALAIVLQNDESLPLSLVIALLLNLLATQVNPLALNGVFLSPFARLSFADKARAFELLEGPDADLVALLDGNLPQPLRGSVSGLLKFVGGALLEFPAFGAFSEWKVFDKKTRKLKSRPAGWQLTGYQPAGPVEGWDDFRGYYQGRTSVED